MGARGSRGAPQRRRRGRGGPGAGLELEVRAYPAGTKTAGDAAAAIGVEVGQIVKSLVFLVDGAGAGAVERPDADAVRAATGFPIGGVPPFGHDLPVYVDEDLLQWDEVWAAAGTWNDVFPIHPAALVRVTGGVVAPLAR